MSASLSLWNRPLTRIPSLRFASLGIRPLPARGARWSKRRASRYASSTRVTSVVSGSGADVVVGPFARVAHGDVAQRDGVVEAAAAIALAHDGHVLRFGVYVCCRRYKSSRHGTGT